MTSTIGVKKIQYPNGTDILTLDSSGTLAIGGNITSNITTTGTVNTPSINSGQIGGRRNIIINGAMQIFQRGTSLNQSAGTNTYTHSADRFRYEEGIEQWAGTMSQSTDTPANEQFQYSLKTLTTATETAIDADDFLQHCYYVEVNDGARIGFGKSSCKISTLSFHVKSSLAGLYCVAISNHDGSQTLPLEYTIDSANTWEKKTLTVPARTSGTWETTGNAKLMGIRFVMGRTGSSYSGGTAGSWSDDSGYAKLFTSNTLADWSRTTDSEFYLTGVQYEVGEQATPFEHKSFGEEYNLCQRYYQHLEYPDSGYHIANGNNNTNSQSVYQFLYYGGPMRATPTITTPSVSNGYRFVSFGADDSHSTIPNIDNASRFGVQFGNNQNTVTGGRGARMFLNANGASIQFNAEL